MQQLHRHSSSSKFDRCGGAGVWPWRHTVCMQCTCSCICIHLHRVPAHSLRQMQVHKCLGEWSGGVNTQTQILFNSTTTCRYANIFGDSWQSRRVQKWRVKYLTPCLGRRWVSHHQQQNPCKYWDAISTVIYRHETVQFTDSEFLSNQETQYRAPDQQFEDSFAHTYEVKWLHEITFAQTYSDSTKYSFDHLKVLQS